MQSALVKRVGMHCRQLQFYHQRLYEEWLMAARTRTAGRHTTYYALPNVISYNAALSACEQGGKWQHVLGLLLGSCRATILPSELVRRVRGGLLP